jgi:hypothetical protein
MMPPLAVWKMRPSGAVPYFLMRARSSFTRSGGMGMVRVSWSARRRSLSEKDYAHLVTAAHRALNARVILVWDNLNTHHSRAMRAFADGHPNWLTVIQLPGYRPGPQPGRGRLVQHEERSRCSPADGRPSRSGCSLTAPPSPPPS